MNEIKDKPQNGRNYLQIIDIPLMSKSRKMERGHLAQLLACLQPTSECQNLIPVSSGLSEFPTNTMGGSIDGSSGWVAATV